MKSLKLLPMFVFALCLVGSVSAIAVYGDFSDETQSATITIGESAVFRLDAISINPPMTINIDMYDSQSNLVYSFEDDLSISDTSYFAEYTIDSSVYTETGYYELIMSGSDSVNTDSHTLSLTVNAITDTNIPIITLLGDNPVTVTLGSTYTDAGATAYDTEDGDITSSIVVTGSVDTSTLGNYVLTYNVQDSAGNSAAPVTRTVSVVEAITDTTAPVITLLGYNPISIPLGYAYTDAGATALDNVDGDITAEIVVGGDVVDTNATGIYIITYNVEDSSGNAAEEVVRIVNVYDPNSTTAPTITVIIPEEDGEYDDSELTFEVEVDEIAEVEFSLDGSYRIAMDYQGMTSSKILTFVYDIALSDGEHEVTFYATNAAGNEASRTVEFLIDTNKESDDKQSDKKYTNYYQNDYEEELYLDQFDPKKIIYLEEEVQPKEDMNWWQKFIAWLKRIFGFD